jgi:hypothetical protein
VSNLSNPYYSLENDSQQWYKKAWNTISNFASGVGSDAVNSGRMWTGKLID